jgi:hypothetical protein
MVLLRLRLPEVPSGALVEVILVVVGWFLVGRGRMGLGLGEEGVRGVEVALGRGLGLGCRVVSGGEGREFRKVLQVVEDEVMVEALGEEADIEK